MSTAIDHAIDLLLPLTEAEQEALADVGLTGSVLVSRKDGRTLTVDDRKAALAALHGSESAEGKDGSG